MFEQSAIFVGSAAACVAAVFAILCYIRSGHPVDYLTPRNAAQLLRSETEIVQTAIYDHGRGLRQELNQSFGILRDGIDAQVRGFGDRLNLGIKAIDDRAAAIATKLNDDMAQMRVEAGAGRETLRGLIETKLDASIAQQSEGSKVLREELGGNFLRLGTRVSDSLSESSAVQKERLENVTIALTDLSGKLEKAQEGLRVSVEVGLDKLRTDNAEKLEQMRVTVDEKLQGTLEQRLGASFKQVSDQLEQVFRGVGEMQTLATGVGDLKRVLSSVKMRGTWGEVSLGSILDQMMASDQYARNVEIKPGSNQRVEYAIKLPGTADGEGPLWIPIDAKFPTEDYERLIDASEIGDVDAVEVASKGLEARVRAAAKDICTKYVHPPHSTDFGVLFLPTEGLFAEVIRRPGLIDALQRECRIVVTGPTTLMALLNSLQMGFRTLAIQKRSSEVWQVLAAVKTEFSKYGQVMEKVQKKLQEASNSIDEVAKRRRAIDRKLRDVQVLPDLEARALLAISSEAIEEADSQVEEGDVVSPAFADVNLLGPKEA
jgi:DNA recombination protein RmuC